MTSNRIRVLLKSSTVLAAASCVLLAAQVQAAEVDRIVVTAQKRDQSAVEVPISVTSLTAEVIENAGIASVTDLSLMTPGLYISRRSSFVQPVIRGIGTTVTSMGSDANVSIYVDGVYQPSQTGNAFSLVDIEQIDVLKGPQGTLFGRNATGGAILITTRKPSLDEAGGRLSASYGRFNEVGLRGYLSTPLSDNSAVSLGLAYKADDGYARDVLLNEDVATHEELSVRSRFLLAPTDRSEFIVSGFYSQVENNTGFSLEILNGNTIYPTAPFFPDPSEIAQSFVPHNEVTSWGFDGTATFDLDAVTLKSVTSYASVETDILSDLDGTNVDGANIGFVTEQKTFTQEINLSSSGDGSMQWVAGAFYYRDDGDEPEFVFNGNALLTAMIDTQAYALFGEVEYQISDRFFAIAGVRYSSETREFEQNRSSGAVNADDETWTDWTPRFSLRYALSDRSNIYVTYSNGFKSGTYNVTANTDVAVNPETVEAYEIGYKFAGEQATFATSTFYYDYQDLQVQAIDSTTGLTRLTNAGVAEIYGADAEVTAALGESWLVQAGIAYTHATYDSFPNAQVNLPKAGGGNSAVSPYDATGNWLSRSPELTVNASATYTTPFAGGDMDLTLTGKYQSEFFFEPANRLSQDSIFLLNARAAWTPAGERYRLSVWGANLTDEAYAQYEPSTTRGDRIAYARPRTYGVSIDLDF